MKSKIPLLISLLVTTSLCLPFYSFKKLVPTGAYLEVPLSFYYCCHSPVISVLIEGKKFLLSVDTGTFTAAAFFSNSLEKIEDKKSLEPAKSFDVKGNSYESLSYSIPPMSVHLSGSDSALILENVCAKEEDLYFLTEGSKIGERSYLRSWRTEVRCKQLDGRFGLSALQEVNSLFDLANQKLYLFQKEKPLSTQIPIVDFTEVPFELTSSGVVLTVDTELGPKKMVLDSGASRTLLRGETTIGFDKAQKIQLDSFKIGNRDYGKRELAIFPISSQFSNIDGFLGVDFMKYYPIALDFASRKAYIAPPKSPFEVWQLKIVWFLRDCYNYLADVVFDLTS